MNNYSIEEILKTAYSIRDILINEEDNDYFSQNEENVSMKKGFTKMDAEPIDQESMNMGDYNPRLGNLSDDIYESGLYPSMRPELNQILIVLRSDNPENNNTLSHIITPALSEEYFSIYSYQGIMQVLVDVEINLTDKAVLEKMQKYTDDENYHPIDMNDIIQQHSIMIQIYPSMINIIEGYMYAVSFTMHEHMRRRNLEQE